MNKMSEVGWQRAYAAACEGVGIIEPDKIQKYSAEQMKLRRDWREAYRNVGLWKVWHDACPRAEPGVSALLETAAHGLPGDIGEQAKLAVTFFPDGDLSSIDSARVTLTARQEACLFGLASMQGMLMSGLVDPACAGLGDRAKEVIGAMAKYWVVNYGSIWKHAVKIPCVNGLSVHDSAANRDKILRKAFESACVKVVEYFCEPVKKVSAQAALAYMTGKFGTGLDDLLSKQATLDDCVKSGMVVLSDAIYMGTAQTHSDNGNAGNPKELKSEVVEQIQGDKRDGWTICRLSVIKWRQTLKYPVKETMETFTITARKCWEDIELLMKGNGDYVKVNENFLQRFNKGEAKRFRDFAIEAEGKGVKGTKRYRLRK